MIIASRGTILRKLFRRN